MRARSRNHTYIEVLVHKRFPNLKTAMIKAGDRVEDYHNLSPELNIDLMDMSENEAQQILREASEYRAELASKSIKELMELNSQEHEKERQEAERNLFYNLPEADADFNHWSKMAYWSIEEAIALSFGKNPKMVSWQALQECYFKNTDFMIKYNEIRDIALRAVKWKQLSDPIEPLSFIQWANKTGISVPDLLVDKI